MDTYGNATILCTFNLARFFHDCAVLPDEREIFTRQVWGHEDKQNLLNKLAEMMLDHKKALCVAQHFSCILLEILTQTKNLLLKATSEKQSIHLKFSKTLSYLLQEYSCLLSFVLQYFMEFGPLLHTATATDGEIAEVIETSHRFLTLMPEVFCNLWDWSLFCRSDYLSTAETGRHFLQALSIILKLNDEEKLMLMEDTFGEQKANHHFEGFIKVQDGKDSESSDIKGLVNEIVFTEQDLSRNFIITANILLPRISDVSGFSNNLVPVPSALKNIEALSVALVSRKAILLDGAVGSGKTSLVEHLAGLTGRGKSNFLLKVQLGDQTDSKALIGSYCCCETPGEFVWRPGILTRAVREGCWLLLEDIDCAPMDVISILIPLLESRILSIPGKGNITASPEFKLFATQRVGLHGGAQEFRSESSMLDHLWSKVHIEPLKKDELQMVIKSKFSNLEFVADKLVDVFSMLSSDLNLNSDQDTKISSLPRNKRLSTVRDFIKWCTRVNALGAETPELLTAQDIFQEALDCFCATFPSTDNRLSVAKAIGAKLNMNESKIDYVYNKYKPIVQVAPLSFAVGRVSLTRENHETSLVNFSNVNFAFTRHSLTLLESIAVCVSQSEPVLLVGETGTGKTSAVQYLASMCGRTLVVINMSQQSDSTDLIGGFKPVEMKQLVAPFREEFEKLFCKSFSRKQNTAFLTHVQQCFGRGKWELLFKLIAHSQRAALEKLSKANTNVSLISSWKKIGQRLEQLKAQHKHAESSLAFSFVEGALVKAITRGDWVLLDEINLATPETLECLNGILESKWGSVVVLERGDAEPVVRHEGFRMFACMNPANDVGKKDLPAGIRNRFSEMFISELQDVSDLKTLVVAYLKGLSPTAALINGIVSFYLEIREDADQKLTDGSGNRPYYSLRTLCRALKYASRNPHESILRSVYEGFCVSFLTQLDRSSHVLVQASLHRKLLGHVNGSSLLSQPLPKPASLNEECLKFEGYWISQGNLEPVQSPEYVFTSSVKQNLRDLARIVSGRYFPVLIQGETSVGKTSLINWLAKASGNHCVRINNHEHTDIQEYLGCYTSDEKGKLVFKEGILVDAMRKGYWIILDELNLAPTDVLEALNRLLDDNRELFIPEIQETVKAHPKFMLFATQNPPGQYGGRKILSRAFRNRFVELHFEELPSQELETILHKRCNLPKSYSKKLVSVMLELQAHRRGSSVFAGKQGFITLRDLFRWAERYSRSPNDEGKFFDWDQQLAEDGYFLLAGRCRYSQEAIVVQEVIEKHLKRKIDKDCLFGHPHTHQLCSSSKRILRHVINNCPSEYRHVVFTRNMRRLAVLVGRALEFNEPVLLVGETGCGKTTICQLFSALRDQKLYSVNCHLHTETSDFLGGLRPVRTHNDEREEHVLKLFEWCDGPLVLAMRDGDMFLADEISLADDSVLERLNSVLEPERTLVLAEKGSGGDSKLLQAIDHIVARQGFQLLATMNPGGDYGKKELSPALRNRFTEIWCPANDNQDDVIEIVEHNLTPGIVFDRQDAGSSGIGKAMIQFTDWVKKSSFGRRCTVTIRDFLSWVQFINVTSSPQTRENASLHPALAYVHGAFLVFLDALGLGMSSPFVDRERTDDSRQVCSDFLYRQIKDIPGVQNCLRELKSEKHAMEMDDCNNNFFTVSGFSIPRGPRPLSKAPQQYALGAPTTAENAGRVLRALQLHRPILLEGSPGVGKTSLVSALAKASGHKLVRMNLSEQTDISDLFGADLPVEGGQGCRFSWSDGPLLQALKAGNWIVLDELNLASQSVLEGLNACFDHRGEIFIPELGMSFQVQHEKTRFFACQNPLNQGGGRKGLPKSFLNRFTQVFIEPLSKGDLLFITETMYPKIDKMVLDKMVTFNTEVYQQYVVEGRCGKQGGSWEFNLRDVFRWCDLVMKYQGAGHWNPVSFVNVVYAGRMRTQPGRRQIWELCSSIFGEDAAKHISPLVHITPSHVQIGRCLFPKTCSKSRDDFLQTGPLYLLHRSLKPFECLMTCLEMNWMAILVGPKSSGKTSLVRLAADVTGNKLDVMAMNSAIDTTELLGGYEQVDLRRPWNELKKKVKDEVLCISRNLLHSGNIQQVLGQVQHILHLWFAFREENNLKLDQDETDDSPPFEMLDLVAQMANLIDTAVLICHKNDMVPDSLEKLKDACTNLHSRLTQSNGNPHVSGQFEWVDGQLVQALRQGYWLLIDNVNFCSPSVLDRLNGLLEPGGVLSINERGLVDGQIPVVKPHPDFRLILAMDPKHGEISRAMRNRGVEIFMDGDDSYDEHDLHGILQAAGCRDSKAVNALVCFHRDYVNSHGGSVLNVANAGSLLNELVQRGKDIETSFKTAVNHVYDKSKGVDIDQFTCDIMKKIKDQPLLELQPTLPSAIFLQKDSTHAMIQRHSIPLLKMFKDPDTSQDGIRIAIGLFLEWCTKHDWRLRLDWLRSNLVSNQEIRSVAEICEIAKCLFQKLFDSALLKQLFLLYEVLDKKYFGNKLRPVFQPLNLKVNGPMFDYVGCLLSADEEMMSLLVSRTNRFYLFWPLLHVEVRMTKYSDCLTSKLITSTPLDMSFAFSKGLIRPENLPHPGVAHLFPLCHSFQTFLRYLIEATDVCITNADTFKVWKALKQFRRFIDVCEARYCKDDDFQGLFGLQWKRFKNETFSTICETFCQSDSQINVPAEVVSVISCLDELFLFDDKVAEFHWSMIKQFEHPKVFVFEKLSVLWDNVTKLFFDLMFPNNNTRTTRRLSQLQLREHKKVLLRNMMSLIKLREEKVKEESAVDILDDIGKSTERIGDLIDGHQAMDETPVDDIKEFSELTIRADPEECSVKLNDFLNCDVLQSFCTLLAHCSFLECLSLLKRTALHEKLDLGATVKGFHQWNEIVQSYHDYCVKYVKQVPFNTAFMQYLLLAEKHEIGLSKLSSSMLQLTDACTFYTYPEMDSVDSPVGSFDAVTTPNPSCVERSCFVRSFGSLRFPTEDEEPKTALNFHTPIPLINLDEKVTQCNNLARFFWLNQNYIGKLRSNLSDYDWQLIMCTFVRFLYSATSTMSQEFPKVKDILCSLLNMSKAVTSFDDICTTVGRFVDDFIELYGHVCASDVLQIVKECFRRFIWCLRKTVEVPEDEVRDHNSQCVSKVNRGLCWVYLGLLQTTVFRPVGSVDPVEETNSRLRNIKNEMIEVENELKVRLATEKMLTGVRTDENSDPLSFTQVNPSHVRNLVCYRDSLKVELSEIGEEITFRPTPSKFRKILSVIDHFSASIGNYSGVLDLLKRLHSLITCANDEEMENVNSVAETKSILSNLKMWIKSVKRFLSQLREYVAYQDILGPYMTGLIQIIQGINCIITSTQVLLKWKVFRVKSEQRIYMEASLPQEIITVLLPFSDCQNSLFTKCEQLMSDKVSNGVTVLCEMTEGLNEDVPGIAATLNSKFRRLALMLLQENVHRSGYTKPRDISLLKTIIERYISLWLQYEERRKLMEQEETSLYKFKTKVYDLDESEEEQEAKEMAELFTSFDQEYEDIDSGVVDELGKVTTKVAKPASVHAKEHDLNSLKIPDDDINHLSQVHNVLVSSLPSASRSGTSLNHITLSRERRLDEMKVIVESFNMAGDLVKCADLADSDLMEDPTQNHLFMSSLLAQSLSSGDMSAEVESDKNFPFFRRHAYYDIYHDCNLKEVSQVLPLLSRFSSRLQQLLQEWPEHPALIQLTRTIDRIVSFPVTSPVMKILNGLELLLKQAQEWESNASRHVSIRTHLDEVTHMIIHWRKLELGCWSSLLNVCEERTRKKANQWWFHICHVIQQYSRNVDGTSADFKELILVLQQFIESSSLGEFSERLKLLFSFYCQVTIEEGCHVNSDVKNILWNVHCYYKQFESEVSNLSQKSKTPIEKDLKDFIKIAKWKDINFWAMKQAAAKSHYTLLKLMKKYQVALSAPVDKVLMSSGDLVSFEENSDVESWKTINPEHYLSALYFKDILENHPDQDVYSSSFSQLNKTSSQVFMKMRKLTQTALTALKYERLSESLSNFTDEIIDTAHLLQRLEVGDKTGKERTQFRKHIQVRKKRALAELFKALTKLGVSYRKGMTLCQQQFLKDAMMVDCCDIASEINSSDKLINNVDHPLSPDVETALESSMKYYQKSVSRSTILNNALASPSKELTVGDVNRIKGFSEDLRRLTQKQRERLSTFGKLFSDLRVMSAQLEKILTSSLTSTHPCALPPQKDVAKWTVTLDELLDTSSQVSRNLLLLLETCPKTNVDLKMSPVPQHLSELSKSCKQDDAFVQARNILNTFLEEVSLMKSKAYLQTLTLYSLGTEEQGNAGLFLATWIHYECLQSSFDKLSVISQSLDQFIELDSRENGFGKQALVLKNKILNTCGEFFSWDAKTFVTKENSYAEGDLLKLRSVVSSAVKNIVLSFQRWFKRRESRAAKNSNDDKDDNSKDSKNVDLLEGKYLMEDLDNELSRDIEALSITESTKDVMSVIVLLRATIDSLYKENALTAEDMCGKIIINLVPCLSQYILVVEYYFCQLILCHRNTCKLHSVLLGIFSELLRKGFCLPPDEEQVAGEGATSFEDNEECGIGEGEGRKDVSDKIEDEEQLLGAEREQEDKKEEEGKDELVEEEEHGIEMTDDFDAKAQDMDENKEDDPDESAEEDEDNNIEDQMGDVEGGEDKLDERLWGDSEDEDDDENDDVKEERGEGASAEDQSELVAKEENQGTAKGSNKKQTNEDSEKEEVIHELPEDETDLGNLEDENEFDHAANECDLNQESGKPDDMELSDDLDLDAGSDQEESCEKEKEDESDPEQEAAEQTHEGDIREETEADVNASKEEVPNDEAEMATENEEMEADLDKNDENDEVTSDWRTDSETKGENAEGMDDRSAANSSVGAAASDGQEHEANEEAATESEKTCIGNAISQQDGQDNDSRTTTNISSQLTMEDRVSSYRKQLNKSRADRTLGSSDERIHKRAKVVDSLENAGDKSKREQATSSDLFEHLKGDDELHDAQVYDAATQEQQNKGQNRAKYEDTEDDKNGEKPMDEDWDVPCEDSKRADELKGDKAARDSRPPSNKTPSNEGQDLQLPTEESEMTTPPSNEQQIKEPEEQNSSLYLGQQVFFTEDSADTLDVEKCRSELENQLSKWHELGKGRADEQRTAQDAWRKYELLTSALSQQLCEQLRIVLEPSIANKLKGDYRTGKRLNMRKVIPYIASQFRKDKIWLRRTKRSKRQYQILLAVDDSSSMADNHSKQLAFESLAVITNALTRLEAGEIAICSFGENVQLLHPFHETFTDQSGANILRQFTFEQKKTKVAQLVDCCTSIMISARSRVQGAGTRLDTSQLLLIVSDGRGIFLEGVEVVQRVVRKAKEAGIFLVFVILDNPANKDSVLDIKVPVFRPGQLPELKSYIEQFPFPFYILLRDISALPETLSDSLRQWFELVTNMTT